MLESRRAFRVWPFEGALTRLLRDAPTTIAEMYPRLSYAVAVAEELPARRQEPRRKGRREAREQWLWRLRSARWLGACGATVANEAAALSSEDDFDALFAAAALLRCVVEDVPLASDGADGRAEGAILGTEAVSWKDRPAALQKRNPASICPSECHNRTARHR